ncbi:hypothetical protein KSP40_PGU015172 [Platanthera guangdongensis]|uniref:Uncharacterized protein n=1 Tax=Platanthera guangdongensis TaxID=2320717 RepID=A0ABR2MWW9_9ASPA
MCLLIPGKGKALVLMTLSGRRSGILERSTPNWELRGQHTSSSPSLQLRQSLDIRGLRREGRIPSETSPLNGRYTLSEETKREDATTRTSAKMIVMGFGSEGVRKPPRATTREDDRSLVGRKSKVKAHGALSRRCRTCWSWRVGRTHRWVEATMLREEGSSDDVLLSGNGENKERR